MVSGETVAPPPPRDDIGAITDAHVHVVSDDVARFPRRAAGPGRDWWTNRRVDGDAVLGDIVGAGVARAVVVQAVGAYGTDNRYASSVVDSHPDRLAFVPALDPDGDDPAVELEALITEGSVAGARLFGVDTDPAWLSDGRGRAVWEVAARHGITLVPTLFSDHLAALRILVSETPDARVALDHCAFPDLRSGPPYPGAAQLLALADLPSVHLKITSVVLRDAQTHGGAIALVERLVESFGAERLSWGSDHPQTMELRYSEMVELARIAFRTVDREGHRSIFDLTARRLFWRNDT